MKKKPENQPLLYQDFKKGYGKFPYIILKTGYAIYMQIPIHFNTQGDYINFPGTNLNDISEELISDYENDKTSELHDRLIAHCKWVKHKMETEKIISELNFKAVRSSGAGGQNVNKVSSKVVLTFDLNASQALNEQEKALLVIKLATKLTSENLLILNCDEDRSQLKNKTIVTKRFLDFIEKALLVPKKRKATKVPRSVIEKRIKEKRNTSEIKETRKKPKL